MRRLLLILPVLFAILVAVAFLAWNWYAAPVTRSTQPVIVDITPGPLRQVAAQLHAQGALPHPWTLWLLARARGEGHALRAGEYSVAPGTTVAGLLALLKSGKVLLHSLTLVDGWTFAQVRQAIEADPDLKHALAGLSDAALMARLGHPNESPEGRFYPDTYQFPKGTTDVAFLQRAYREMQSRLAAAWQQRAANLPIQTPYEALILASIVEKETAQPQERPEIAGVFVRRLEKGMRLQSDPTVIFGLGSAYAGKITYKDLRTDTPYNTYTRNGLPPTPICIPGLPAIDAVLHPAAGDALYFVARGNGTHQFSATLAEQNAAVKKYQLIPAPHQASHAKIPIHKR